MIFNSILEKYSVTKSLKDISIQRKIAMWSLCLIVISPKTSFEGFLTPFKHELNLFQSEMLDMSQA